MNTTQKNVTENERNAIFTALTPEECLLLGQSLKDLCNEYKENNGVILLESYIPVLGKFPKIPITLNLDEKLKAAEDIGIYVKKMNSIDVFLKYEFQHGHI